jgi:DNA-binding NarL/FixJ family response regulator
MQCFSVLLVDDFEPFRQFVLATLQGTAHFTVIGEAEDGLQAVQKAGALQPDIVVLDIGLPKLNGIEAAHRISVVAPRSKIVFLSLNNDRDTVNAALSNGAYGYVAKSAANRELLTALEAVVRGEMFVSSEFAPKPA